MTKNVTAMETVIMLLTYTGKSTSEKDMQLYLITESTTSTKVIQCIKGWLLLNH